jgi:hypothetical protein
MSASEELNVVQEEEDRPAEHDGSGDISGEKNDDILVSSTNMCFLRFVAIKINAPTERNMFTHAHTHTCMHHQCTPQHSAETRVCGKNITSV